MFKLPRLFEWLKLTLYKHLQNNIFAIFGPISFLPFLDEVFLEVKTAHVGLKINHAIKLCFFFFLESVFR